MFWKPADDKNSIRKKLGLFKNIKTVLLMGGGDGVGGMKAITYRLVHRLSKMKKSDDIFYKRYEPVELAAAKEDELKDDEFALSQVVVICGHNKQLYDEIQRRKWPKNVKVVAKKFVNNVDEYMAAADCLITKAGPGTIAEAMIRGLPIILSSFLPGQVQTNPATFFYVI
jgi:1,2-diacylglycerol 3-beta-galactosyltransferase